MGLFTKTYDIEIKCINCGFKNRLGVPKGTTIREFLNEKQGKCRTCGCLIEADTNGEGKKSWEYKTQWIK